LFALLFLKRISCQAKSYDGIAGLLFGFLTWFIANCNPMEVYMDCYITARNEYLAGNYSYQLYRNFVEDYCVSASNSCPDY